MVTKKTEMFDKGKDFRRGHVEIPKNEAVDRMFEQAQRDFRMILNRIGKFERGQFTAFQKGFTHDEKAVLRRIAGDTI